MRGTLNTYKIFLSLLMTPTEKRKAVAGTQQLFQQIEH
jgi:hypothetical protein